MTELRLEAGRFRIKDDFAQIRPPMPATTSGGGATASPVQARARVFLALSATDAR
jgi:hypothetical protein